MCDLSAPLCTIIHRSLINELPIESKPSQSQPSTAVNQYLRAEVQPSSGHKGPKWVSSVTGKPVGGYGGTAVVESLGYGWIELDKWILETAETLTLKKKKKKNIT